jgi:Glycosyl hydrolase family 26
MRKYLLIVLLSICSVFTFSQRKMQLTDRSATKETKALFNNLHRLSKSHILFGHQHATQYGHGWSGDADRSDVKSVTGSHPAVIGVDFSGLSGRPDSLIEKEKVSLKKIFQTPTIVEELLPYPGILITRFPKQIFTGMIQQLLLRSKILFPVVLIMKSINRF